MCIVAFAYKINHFFFAIKSNDQKTGAMENSLFLDVVAGIWEKKKLFKNISDVEKITPQFVSLVACFVSVTS